MKIIDKHNYYVIKACKCDDNLKSLKEYLKHLYLIDEIGDATIYKTLINTIMNICDQKEIEELLKDEFLRYYDSVINYQNQEGLTLKDMIHFLYYRLYFLDMKKIVHRENLYYEEDIYGIMDNDTIIPYSFYDVYRDNKEYQKRLN